MPERAVNETPGHEAPPLPQAPTIAAGTPAASVLALQRTIGNRAVGALLARQTAQLTAGSVEAESRARVGQGTTDELRAELSRLEDMWQHRFERSLPSDVQTYLWDRILRLRTLVAERGDSALPDASVELSFDGTTLTMTGSQSRSWTAVSGLSTATGAFDYSPARQRMESVGAVPEGEYWINPAQMVDLRGRWSTYLFDFGSGLQWGVEFGHFSNAWGTHRITIHPFDATADFGRGGFFIHGGTTRGSKGCIDLTSQMADFAAVIAALPGGQKVRLHVRYPRTGPPPPLAPPGVAD